MSVQLVVALVCALTIPLLLVFLIDPKKKTQASRNLPPGPRKLPIIGNLHQLGSLPHRSLTRLSKQYGQIMFLQLGSIPTLVISSKDVAREVFKAHDRAFSGRPVFYAVKKLSYNCSDVSFGAYGNSWRELRKIVILELLGSKRVQLFESVRKEEVKLMLDAITSSPGPVNIGELALLLANNVVCRVTFGKKWQAEGGSVKSKFHETVREIQSILGGFCVADLFPQIAWFNSLNGFKAKVEKNFRELDKLYDEVIGEHRDPKRPKPNHEYLVDVLLRLQRDPNQVIALTGEQIKGVLTDMFNAGTDTSSATIVWTMTELARHPSVMRKAQEEVREAAKGKLHVEESDLLGLAYLRSVIKEALRLHPPLPLLVPRATIEDCKIRGYEIPRGTTVFVNVTAISTDPNCWENPEEFRPERFLNCSIDFKGQNYELLPFGSGRRGCPGIHFGVVIVELALANLLHQFDWKLPEGMRVEDIDMEEAYGLTTNKRTPLCLIATPVNG
ncbi:cytochrome P450 71A9-like isoform X1 [Rhodamnia argentea]|uniref:Cytochrome P450 71A9-like isoform X1 n=1 Tax=Rhodamnia argentea TaxID=178133 RepID=A0ABM3HI55_9MYRT|nr:cytochrome P450 71A9-like isoform X1 [Rhodamnia argentea]